MTSLTPLHEALLELGLEDQIPLPEVFGNRDLRAAIGGVPTVDEVAAALVDLLRLKRISVWQGHWADEPRRVDHDDAERLLDDRRRYAFENEAEGLERVYFVNVENIP